MTKIPNIADIIASYSNQDKTLQESAADLGALILEMEHEEKYYGSHSRRLAELKKLAALQERVWSSPIWYTPEANLVKRK
jgi:hypothetical protein